MPSFVWDRHPEEAYRNPYEYDAQEQFARECYVVHEKLRDLVNPREKRWKRDDRTASKAVWMLRVDTLDSLVEARELIVEKRHRPAARLFRDALETADLAFFFAIGAEAANKHIAKWYENQSPGHRVVRDWMESHGSTVLSDNRRLFYRDLSKFTHRTYRALLKSYILAADEFIVHDSWSPSKSLVLPGVIAAYFCILANLTQIFVEQLVASAAMSREQADQIWAEALEKESAPRRFAVS